MGEAAGAARRRRPRFRPAVREALIEDRLSPLPPSYASTREALRAVACYVVAPARKARTGRIGLRPFAGGVATPPLPDGSRLAVDGDELAWIPGERHRLTTLAAAAVWVGVELTADPGVGRELPPLEPDATLAVHPSASRALGAWYAFGQRVLDALPGGEVELGEAQLWPEHFDLALVAQPSRGGPVNLGCSPGDGYLDQPYVYVGPHDLTGGDGGFWNAPFGAALGYAELLADADPHTRAVEFLVTGLALVARR